MANKTDKLPKQGDVIANKYLVENVLGQGGMGLVVGATHQQLEQKVAIKFLTEEADKDTKQRFNREARAAAKLKSEHVARVHDVGELDDGTPYMVMEYLEGADLQKISKRRGQLPITEAVAYVLQACEAIAEAHSVGIVHRDLKPPNLFLAQNPDGTVTLKVLDFGISKDRTVESMSRTEEDLTKTSMVLGTPHFMAPEQMRSARDVDARADIWSIGAILYQLLTGKRPFRGPTFPELVVRVIQEDPIAPHDHRPDLPPEINAAILKCLEKEAHDRYANVAELCFVIAPFGPPASFSRAQRMARMLGLAPLSTAPGSAPPGSMTDPGVVSSRPGRSRSGPPSSRSWYPDTEQEVGDPTQPDASLGLQASGSHAISVDVVGLSAFDKTAVADPAMLPGRTSETIDEIPSGSVPSTQMTAETSIATDTAKRRKGPSLRTLGILAGGSVALLVAVAVLKPVGQQSAPTRPAATTTGAAPATTTDVAPTTTPSESAAPATADPEAAGAPPNRPGPAAPRVTPKREPEPDEPEPEPKPDPEPEPKPDPEPEPKPDPKPKATPPPRPPPPKPPPPPPPPPPKPPSNPLDMELK